MRHKKLILISSATLLVVVAVVAIAASRRSSVHSIKDPAVRSLVKSSCGSTLYPELCFSAISAAPEAATKITKPKDVIELSLNLTVSYVEENYAAAKKLVAARGKTLSHFASVALHDCFETSRETLEELRAAQRDLHDYPTLQKSIAEHADDIMILVSAAMTNQETCVDGFSDAHNKTDEKTGEPLKGGQMHVFRMCSNVLAMVKNLTDGDKLRQQLGQRPSERNLREGGQKGWPRWISAGDRRLLLAQTVVPNVTVAKDGSGNFTTVSEAVAAAPNKTQAPARYIIQIKAGIYHENVEVPKKKTNLMFVGEGKGRTIITGSKNVVDGSTTFHSATVAIVGQGFLGRDITFENSAGPSKHQAVALRVGSDMSAFYNCQMLGYQDTLYVHSLRQFYVNCSITGTVDFIFGNAAAVFQDCDIHARRPNEGQKNMITAQGREDPNQNTGIVIQKSRIGAIQDLEATKSSFPTFLGRPWKMYSRTVVMQSQISDVVHSQGWHEWHEDFALDTLFYAEYQNTGPGASTAKRVAWKGFKLLNATEAQAFTAENFISGSHWLNSTGFPFSLGL